MGNRMHAMVGTWKRTVNTQLPTPCVAGGDPGRIGDAHLLDLKPYRDMPIIRAAKAVLCILQG
jgi:hypothetical protein